MVGTPSCLLLRATLLCALITLSIMVPVPASQPAPAASYIGPHSGVTRPDWITFTARMAHHYRVRPAFALGVAFAEGSLGDTPFRFGRHGRYWLPWGIHNYVVKERGWPVWDIYVQTEVAIRALARHMAKARKEHPGISVKAAEALALHKYNASFDLGYLKRVREGERRFGRMVE